jgi:hypothetical protein
LRGGTPTRPASRLDLPLAGGGKAESAAVRSYASKRRKNEPALAAYFGGFLM